MRDLRVLCLHGYHGSAAVLRRQMAPLVSAMPANVAFVYVDAPSLAVGDFGWWHAGRGGWERTRAWAVELFRAHGGFDGVFGFSQGAAMTGLLSGLNEAGAAVPDADISFTFGVMVGGFKSDAAQPADLFAHRLTIPSVHVMGRSDTIVPRSDSRPLAEQFVNPLVLEHPGGHVIPGDPTVTGPIALFLTDMSGDS
jgi:fermentation-respiration switch protein FrsA (DUF1100 family)